MEDDYYQEVKITKVKKGTPAQLVKVEKRKERFLREEEEAKSEELNHLEKAFVRLGINDTTDTVRTPEQLIEAFDHVVNKYSETSDFEFLDSQLRGIR